MWSVGAADVSTRSSLSSTIIIIRLSTALSLLLIVVVGSTTPPPPLPSTDVFGISIAPSLIDDCGTCTYSSSRPWSLTAAAIAVMLPSSLLLTTAAAATTTTLLSIGSILMFVRNFAHDSRIALADSSQLAIVSIGTRAETGTSIRQTTAST